MVNSYKVQVLHFSNILEIEGARTTRDFEALLDAMEYGSQSGMSDDEKREMCILSLQDLEPEEAAYQVLKHDMADLLRDGQMRNAAGEMQDEKLWEEYSNSTLHERFFNAGSLLYAALPKSFPKPDAVRLELQVTAVGAGAKHLLKNVNNETFLVRLLADGMDDHAILHRLYGDQLSGKSFPNAAEVVWTVRAEPVGEDAVKLEIISSGYWLDALERTKSYESTAYADEV
ncbi:hypothetical protein [Nisaea nitritireducens]|uniref:hypothetical protein n=1 Tax=Nisaea nitritireducens TaxID=568392 RepID=UPI001865BBF5|nr:hypothetical protein [Nisaea nitritireducens]